MLTQLGAKFRDVIVLTFCIKSSRVSGRRTGTRLALVDVLTCLKTFWWRVFQVTNQDAHDLQKMSIIYSRNTTVRSAVTYVLNILFVCKHLDVSSQFRVS